MQDKTATRNRFVPRNARKVAGRTDGVSASGFHVRARKAAAMRGRSQPRSNQAAADAEGGCSIQFPMKVTVAQTSTKVPTRCNRLRVAGVTVKRSRTKMETSRKMLNRL